MFNQSTYFVVKMIRAFSLIILCLWVICSETRVIDSSSTSSQLVDQNSVRKRNDAALEAQINVLRESLENDPSNPAGWLHLGLLLQSMDMRHHNGGALQDDILESFDEALSRAHPLNHNIRIRANMHKGMLLKMMSKGEESLNCYDTALRVATNGRDRSSAMYHKADTLVMMGRLKEALIIYNDSMKLAPWRIDTYLPIVSIYDEMKSLSPSQWEDLFHEIETVYLNCSSMSMHEESKNPSIVHAHEIEACNPRQASGCLWSLYRSAEKAGLYSEAWKYLELAHEVEIEKRESYEYDPEKAWAQTTNIFSVFSSSFFPNPPVGHPSKVPIFIVGMMRSGSTLLETMLDAHPEIWGMGEDSIFNGFLEEIRQDLLAISSSGELSYRKGLKKSNKPKSKQRSKNNQLPDRTSNNQLESNSALSLENPSSFDVDSLAESSEASSESSPLQDSLNYHGQRIVRSMIDMARRSKENIAKRDMQNESKFIENSGTRFVVDKMLFNYRNIGFIHLVFPNAVILHTFRDPMDTLFSCYKHKFDDIGLEWSLNLQHLAQQYIMYLDIMDHFRKVLPGRVIDIRYESVVHHPKEVLANVLNQIGVPWNDSVLNFHSSKRIVQTHSQSQVRQGLYTGSIGSWRKYSAQLQPLMNILRPALKKRLDEGRLPFADSMNWLLDPTFDYNTPPPLPPTAVSATRATSPNKKTTNISTKPTSDATTSPSNLSFKAKTSTATTINPDNNDPDFKWLGKGDILTIDKQGRFWHRRYRSKEHEAISNELKKKDEEPVSMDLDDETHHLDTYPDGISSGLRKTKPRKEELAPSRSKSTPINLSDNEIHERLYSFFEGISSRYSPSLLTQQLSSARKQLLHALPLLSTSLSSSWKSEKKNNSFGSLRNEDDLTCFEDILLLSFLEMSSGTLSPTSSSSAIRFQDILKIFHKTPSNSSISSNSLAIVSLQGVESIHFAYLIEYFQPTWQDNRILVARDSNRAGVPKEERFAKEMHPLLKRAISLYLSGWSVSILSYPSSSSNSLAVDLINLYLEAHPSAEFAKFRRAEIFSSQGQADLCLKDLQELVENFEFHEHNFHASLVDIHVLLGLTYFKKKFMFQSYEHFKEAFQNHATDSRRFPCHYSKGLLYHFLGKCEKEMGQLKVAIVSFNNALSSLEADNSGSADKREEIMIDRAASAMELGLYQAAFEEMNSVLASNGGSIQAYGYLALLLQSLGRTPEEIDTLQKQRALWKLADGSPFPRFRSRNTTSYTTSDYRQGNFLLSVAFQAQHRFQESIDTFSWFQLWEPGHTTWYRRELTSFQALYENVDWNYYSHDFHFPATLREALAHSKQAPENLRTSKSCWHEKYGKYVKSINSFQRNFLEDMKDLEENRIFSLRVCEFPVTALPWKKSSSRKHPLSEKDMMEILSCSLLSATSSSLKTLVEDIHNEGLWKWIQLNTEGFLPHRRYLRSFGLMVTHLAQEVKFHAWMKAFSDKNSSSVLWVSSSRSSSQGKSFISHSEDSNSLPASFQAKWHQFHWRDFFDIVADWRRVSEPMDIVYWIDQLPPKIDFRDRVGLNTYLTHGYSRVSRYYPYFNQTFQVLKEGLLNGRAYDPREDKIVLSPHQRFRIELAQNLLQVFQAVKQPFFVVAPCASFKDPSVILNGTRVTLTHPSSWSSNWSPANVPNLDWENSWDFSICSASTPERFRDFEVELEEAFTDYLDTLKQLWIFLASNNTNNNNNNYNNSSTSKDNNNDSEYSSLSSSSDLVFKDLQQAVFVQALRMFYYWVNYAPLTRGSSQTGSAILVGALLAADMKLSQRMPTGKQLDWEALLNPSFQAFYAKVSSWLPYENLSPMSRIKSQYLNVEIWIKSYHEDLKRKIRKSETLSRKKDHPKSDLEVNRDEFGNENKEDNDYFHDEGMTEESIDDLKEVCFSQDNKVEEADDNDGGDPSLHSYCHYRLQSIFRTHRLQSLAINFQLDRSDVFDL